MFLASVVLKNNIQKQLFAETLEIGYFEKILNILKNCCCRLLTENFTKKKVFFTGFYRATEELCEICQNFYFLEHY